MREILTFCEAAQPWLLETISALVRAESPTDDKTAVDACGRVLEALLHQCGAHVTRIPQTRCGDQLRAEWKGSSGKQILLLGHFDTVWSVGQLARMPLREDGGRLCGPGIFDMKAGISIGMQAIRALQATAGMPAAGIVMLVTTD